MPLEIALLGPVEARLDGAPLVVGGARQRRLLGHLALTPGRIRSVDSVASAVWPDGDLPQDTRSAVYTYVSRLRTSLCGDVVQARDGGYVLTVSPESVDVGRFEALLRQASDPGCSRQQAIDILAEALALWRGHALDGFETEEWARGECARLEEMRARAIDDRAEALLASGRAPECIADLEAAVFASPLREHTYGLLMSALHECGRQAEALRVFQRYRRRLATDLGLEPGTELQRIEAAIAADVHVGAPRDDERVVRGYVLSERIGDGSFAVVYRGTQPSVGRDVAVKVIRAELANRPEFIRRFEIEAHLVARLEHPHIVPLYDYWREPGSAFLVMRLLRGGTLDRRIESRQLDLEEGIRLATHVGQALSVAHRAGIVHRDVKPANVFLDEEGNFFLGDFGIAYEAAAPVHATDTLSVGSPAYASPEQLRREPVGPPADVHGLAITLFEAFTGRLPFPDARTQAELLRRQLNDPLPSLATVRSDLPRSLDAVFARATAKDPSDRFASIEEFVSALTSAAHGAASASRLGTSTVVGEIRNPYKGLRAFQEADAGDFYGRQRLVDRLVERLAAAPPTARFLTVVGPSGSGKSSVVRAGLVPALRAGALPGSTKWFLTSMIPGAHPFEELESALNRIAVTPTVGLAELMASDRRGVARAVKQACPVDDAELVVVIDQFEELFTLCNDEVTRQKFIAGLVEAIGDPRSRLRVVATLRADFYDRPLRYPELATLIEDGAVTVSPLAPDELERAITEPAARVGAAFEPGLVAQMVADVLDRPGALPLLQYSLTEVFDQNVSGLLTLRAYTDLGGLLGALARRADQLYLDLPAERQADVARVFTRLVTLGEGTEDMRRRVRRSEFGATNPVGDSGTDVVIDAYGAARLLAFDRDPATREPTVEVAHEALIREWPRLRQWLNEDRDALRIHRHLTEAAMGWAAAGRDAGDLYGGGRLEVAETWAVDHAGDLNPTESAFLGASVEQRRRSELAERRSRQRIHRALVTVAAVAVLALLAGVIALQQRRDAVSAKDRATAAAAEARSQESIADANADRADAAAVEAAQGRDRARVERLVAESRAEVDSHLDVAMLLAVEAWRRDPSPATSGALLSALTAQVSADLPTTTTSRTRAVRRSTSRVLGFIPVPFTDSVAIELSADGRVLALSGGALSDPQIALFDTESKRQIATVDVEALQRGGGEARDFDLSPDGTRLLLVDDVHVTVVDLANGARTALPKSFAAGATIWVDAVFADDSRTIIVRDGAGRVSAWDAETLELLGVPLPATATLGPIGVTEDGILTYGNHRPSGVTLGAWDLAAGTELSRAPLAAPSTWPTLYGTVPDLSVVVGAVSDLDPIVAWDRTTGELIDTPNAPAGRTLAIDPNDPSLVVVGSGSGLLTTYDLRAGRVVGAPLHRQGPGIRGIAVAPRGGLMATVAEDGIITLWGDNEAPGLLDASLGGEISQAVFGGDTLVVRSLNRQQVEIRRADQPGSRGALIDKPGWAEPYPIDIARPSVDGSAVLVHGSLNNKSWTAVVDAGSGEASWTLRTNTEMEARGAAISDDGALVAVSDDSLIVIYDVATGEQRARIELETFISGPMVFTADASHLDVDTVDGLRRYDLRDGTYVAAEHSIFSQGRVAQIPETDDVVGFGGLGEGLARWNMATGELVATSGSRDGSNLGDVAISPDGTLAVAYHPLTGNISVYDLATMREVGLIPAGSGLNPTLGFTADGRLVADGVNGTARVWDLDPAFWAATACHAVGRNLTQEEWQRYFGTGEPYHATCDEWPRTA